MVETSDQIIFLLVVGGRFLLPFLIFRWPLAIILSLILDAVDQTIFQVFTSVPLDGYQTYDKALDVFYLTIAYIATMRNWNHFVGFKTSRFLFYYRIAGVALFELTHIRTLLLIFANTFEYFFIYIEAVRTRWNIVKLTSKFMILSAAFIWIFIKLPQEYWIHIAQLDTTDFIKETIFGMPTDTTWSALIAANIWLIPAAILLTVILIYLTRVIIRKLPPKDWNFTLDIDKHLESPKFAGVSKVVKLSDKLTKSSLFEKIMMITIVTIIFGQLLSVRATVLQLTIAITLVVVLNVVVSHILAIKGFRGLKVFPQFIAISILNLIIIVVYASILAQEGQSLNIGNAVFFSLLFSVLITLYDRYRPIYEARFLNKK